MYKVAEDVAVVFTMDFFPPITGDAYMFGQIAAANALSDVYAMGAEPRLALNLFCFPSCMPASMAGDILRGGCDKVREAGCILCGGHTINDDVPKYGLAVNGFIHPSKILRNSTAQPGDVLILTKPVGSGVLTTAVKGGLMPAEDISNVYTVMAFLNKTARDVLVRYDVHALTDVTGFGLLGHCYEMAKGSEVDVELSAQDVPIFADAVDYAGMGILAAGVYANRSFVGDSVQFQDVDRAIADVMFDPQTSGGLLISVACHDAIPLYTELCKSLSHTVCGKPAIIGQVLEKKDRKSSIIVKNKIDLPSL